MIYYIGNSSEFPTCSPEDVINFCRERKVVGFDYETTGLDYYLDKPVLVSIGDYHAQYVVDIREIGMYWFKDILESHSITKVCHNCQFEYNMSKQYGIICANLWDTMLGEMILHTDKLTIKGRFTLEYLVKDYFGVDLDKETQTSFINFTGEFSKRQIEYSANDIRYMSDLRDRLLKQILEQNMQVKIDMENENALVAGDQSYNGIYLNKEKWMKLYEQNLQRVNQLITELDSTLATEYTTVVNNLSLLEDYKELQSGRLLSLNWNSPQQTKPVFKQIGIKAVRRDKKTKENKETMDIKSLKKIKNKPEILKKFIEYREFFKTTSSFGEKFLRHVHPITGRIHPEVNTIVSTGRESQRKPNCQNIKRGSDYRECFEGQGDNTLIGGDYQSQEICVIADKAKEISLIKALNERQDIHSVVGTQMFTAFYKRPFIVTKEDVEHRYKAKTTQFRVLYGTGASTLAEEFSISTKEAQKIIDSYWEGFPAVFNYINKERTFAIVNGYSILDDITNGRRVYDKYSEFRSLQTKVNSFVEEFGEEEFFSSLEVREEPINSYYRRAKMLRADIEREAGNATIQGCSSSMTKYAGILLRRKLLLHKITPVNHYIKIVNKVHDELVLEAMPEYADLAKDLLTSSMKEAADMFLDEVEINCEVYINKYWKK